MAKAAFARATLTYDAVEQGIFDLTIDSTYSEIDVTDTETTTGQSEFLGGKQIHTISFSTYKDAGTADLVLNLTSSNSCIITIVSATGGDDTLYTGNLVLLNKSITGNIEGAVQLAYSGKISGALAETQPA
jgi:predicted secreted protein